MPLCFPVIPTRGRTDQVVAQIGRLLVQLKDRERIIVVVDQDDEAAAALIAMGGADVEVVSLKNHVGVDRARRIGTAFVPDSGIVVELDDHDLVEPTLLQEVRAAFEDRAVKIAYCDCWMTDPEGRVERLREKVDGEFREHGNLGLGMRAYRKWLYDAVGGYPLDYFPANDLALLCMMDQMTHFRARRRIAKPLVKVVLDETGVSATHRQAQEEAVMKILNIANNGGFTLGYRLNPARQRVQGAQVFRAESAAPCLACDGKAPKGRPRIALVTHMLGAGRGGGELSMLALLRKAHAACGYQITALYEKDAGDVPLQEPWLRTAKYERPEELDALLEQARPDLIVTEVRTAPRVMDRAVRLGIPVLTLVQFWRSIVEMTEAGFDAVDARPLPREALDLHGVAALRKSAALVANSEFTAEVIREALRREPDAVVYPPIDPAFVVAADATPVHERVFITCPSSQEGKGSLIFLALARRHPELKFLLLAGDARHTEASEVLAAAESLPNVTVERGWIADMRSIYAKTRLLFIGTQTAESFSRASAEAIANGIPLLTSSAGNLKRMADGKRGIAVAKRAGIEAWDDALQKALALRPAPDASLCQDHSARFVDVIDKTRLLSETAILVPQAAGVSTGAAQLKAVLGMELLPWGAPMGAINRHALTILPGTFDPEIARAATGTLLFWWCSHAAQMDTNRHEMEALLQVIAAVRERANCHLAFTSEPDARLWQRAAPGKVHWLPNCLRVQRVPAASRLQGRHVWIPGPYVARKNVYTALGAIAQAGGTAHVTDRAIVQCPTIQGMAKMLGVELHVHTCPERAELMEAVARCRAAVMASTAETYCYAAAECVMAGLPTVAWAGIPALRQSPMALMVADPTNVSEVGVALSAALEPANGSLAQAQYESLRERAWAYNRQARATLLEVLHG